MAKKGGEKRKSEFCEDRRKNVSERFRTDVQIFVREAKGRSVCGVELTF